MRFGSVEFFKVLIKTVLAILFFVPLILCIVFAVILWNKSNELEKVSQENERISLAAEILIGERAGDVESFYDIYAASGNSDEELIAYINEKSGSSDEKTNLGSKTDVPENGESAEAAIAQPQDETAENAGGETEAVPTNEPQSDDETEISSDSPYQYIYPDMMVDTPAATVREQGTVYLTFDDGPSSNTEAILNYLREYNIKATFFVVPNRSEECYERLRAIVNDGHSIGVHSASHDYEKIYASVEAYLDDFYEAWDIIYEATGVKTEIFRFPGGSKNDFNEATRDEIIEEMTRRGFRFYDWNVDSNDAGGANWSDMYNSVPEDISGNYRSIVLMHDSDTRTNTVLVLEDILNVLVGEGYKLDKISNDTRPVQFIGPYA